MSNLGRLRAGFEHLVVVVLENRSLDNMLGTLHTDGTAPSVVLPAGSAKPFDGLRPDLSNPANPGYFDGGPPQSVPITPSIKSSTVPDPDPEETFTNVTFQIFGPDYAQTGTSDPTQVPILWALARNYAVSDAWFASVPSQTSAAARAVTAWSRARSSRRSGRANMRCLRNTAATETPVTFRSPRRRTYSVACDVIPGRGAAQVVLCVGC